MSMKFYDDDGTEINADLIPKMLRNTLKFAKFLVGAHLLLGLALLVTEATHGINDQDPSFALALLVHYMNLPSIWLLNWLGVPYRVILIVPTRIPQWTIIALAMAAAYHYFRAMARVVQQDRSGKLANIRLHLTPFRLPNAERPKMGMFEFDSIAVEEVVASINSHEIMNA